MWPDPPLLEEEHPASLAYKRQTSDSRVLSERESGPGCDAEQQLDGKTDFIITITSIVKSWTKHHWRVRVNPIITDVNSACWSCSSFQFVLISITHLKHFPQWWWKTNEFLAKQKRILFLIVTAAFPLSSYQVLFVGLFSEHQNI